MPQTRRATVSASRMSAASGKEIGIVIWGSYEA
jgi:hypothetical protein